MNQTENHTFLPQNQVFSEGRNEGVLSLISMAIVAIEPDAEVFLFGSRADETATPRSDYDIAVNCHERIPLETMSRFRGALEDLPIMQKVDIVDVYRTSEEFRKIAFSDRKRIV